MFNIISNQFLKKGILKNNVRSCNWHELYLDQEGTGGDFEFEVKGDYYNGLIQKGDFIQNTKSRKFGVVEEIKKETDDDGQVLTTTYSGRMGEKLLMQRCIYPQLNLSGTAIAMITDIMSRNVIAPAVTSRKMPFSINVIDNCISELTFSFCGETVAKALYSILSSVDMSYYCSLDMENKKVVLNIFKTTDKTTQITFSTIQKNIYDYSELSSNKDAFNHVIVKGAQLQNQIPYVTSFQKGLEGFDRIEKFEKEESLDNKQLTLSDYQSVLKNKGRNKLIEGIVEDAYDFAIYKGKYVYNKDICLGDIVSLYSLDFKKTTAQKVIGYLYTKSSNGSEDEGYTFQQIAELTDDIDTMIELGDGEQEDITTDITNNNSSGDDDNKGGGVEIVGRVLVAETYCADGTVRKVDGTIQKLDEMLYRINIYTYEDNHDVNVIDAETGENAVDENGNPMTIIKKVPYSGHIYFGCDFDILSYVDNGTGTVDIDNFDNTKTRIKITSSRKGVLYRDKWRVGNPIRFENITEQNIDDKIWYEYEIESENLNFNFSSIISLKPMEDEIPVKDYRNYYPVYLKSLLVQSRTSSPFGRTDSNFHENLGYEHDFEPWNFIADEGDTLSMKFNYIPITHTGDPDVPYEIARDESGKYLTEEYRTITYTFKQDEPVRNVLLELPEGYYGWLSGGKSHCNFTKIRYYKRYLSDKSTQYVGQNSIYFRNASNNEWVRRDSNNWWLVRMDPAFDNIEGLVKPKWEFFEMNNSNDRTITKEELSYNCGYDGLAYLISTESSYNGNPYILKGLCEDEDWPEKKAKLLADEAAEATTTE